MEREERKKEGKEARRKRGKEGNIKKELMKKGVEIKQRRRGRRK